MATAVHDAAGEEISLASPFELVSFLPAVFSRANPGETFSAKHDDRTYWLASGAVGQLCIYYGSKAQKGYRKHRFQTCTSLMGTRICRAIEGLTITMRDLSLRDLGDLDITGFIDDVRQVSSDQDLVSPDSGIELARLEQQALQYMCLMLDLGPDARLYCGETIDLDDGMSSVSLGHSLPSPLSRIRPSLEVWIQDGELCDLRAPFVETGAGSPGSILEKMRQLRNLFNEGFPDSIAATLNEFISELRQSGDQ